jgi:hypothetical protein
MLIMRVSFKSWGGFVRPEETEFIEGHDRSFEPINGTTERP